MYILEIIVLVLAKITFFLHPQIRAQNSNARSKSSLI